MERCILFSFAHPDDESFAAAGTAMKYGAAGVRSVLVTATRGDKGKIGNPPVCTLEELPACRERELEQAVKIIGIDELHILAYRDKELLNAPPDEIRRALISIIRRERPLIVATFDPNGFNAHPDHVAIGRDGVGGEAADPRWHPDTGDPHTVTRVIWTAPVAAWEVGTVERLDQKPGVDFVLDVSTWRDRRRAALRAHRSQNISIDRCFFNQADPDRNLDLEVWRHAWGPPLSQRPSNDLFEAIG
jgi:LmbE family N-acetylglucosaminyl deacetylase